MTMLTQILVNQPVVSPTKGRTTQMPAPDIMPLSNPEMVVEEVMFEPE